MKIIAALLLTTLFAAGPKPRLQSPIESTAREMLTNFASGRFDAATKDFNDDLRPIVTPEVLSDVKGQLDASVGAFYLVKEAHQRTQGGSRTIELIARYAKGSVSVLVVFDALDRIGTVYFNPISAGKADPALESAARELLANFVAGHFADVVKPFDATMRVELTPAGLEALATSIGQIFGKFVSVTEVQQSVDKSYKIIDMTLAYTKGTVAFRVAFDPSGHVVAMHISPFKPQ